MTLIDTPHELRHHTAGCYALHYYGESCAQVMECMPSQRADMLLSEDIEESREAGAADGAQVQVDIVKIEKNGECWLLDTAYGIAD